MQSEACQQTTIKWKRIKVKMKNIIHFKMHQILFMMMLFSFVLSCSSTNETIESIEQVGTNIQGEISSQELVGGIQIKDSGWMLINRANGLWKIVSDSSTQPENIIIVVHGYQSAGTEWVDAVRRLSEKFGVIYFYRWDWNDCPEEASNLLSKYINYLGSQTKEGAQLTMFSHSYGGVIAAHAASKIVLTIPVEIHVIAAPLKGYPRLIETCSDDKEVSTMHDWSSNINLFQWKTVKKQDGAFKSLDFDPQDLDNEKINVFYLPETMDGHRLGHNWSVVGL